MARGHDVSTSVSALRLRAVFKYDPDAGTFTWLIDTHGNGGHIKSGSSVKGSIIQGRWFIGIDGRRYAAHRLAWLYMTGEWPKEIDHANGDPLDNRWCNLREATRSQNNANVKLKRHNTSGYKGVSWDSERGLWKAQICVNNARKQLGRFENIEAAAAAYKTAAKEHFGEFARLE